MAKSPKNIELEVKEVNKNNQQMWEVNTQKQENIGVIEPTADQFKVTMAKSGHSFNTKTLEIAINELISYFNLHEFK